LGAEVKQPGLGREQILTTALEHLRAALELLDSTDAPAHIGAHIDLALNQLEAEALTARAAQTGMSERSAARH
jgi:hypothetical protein